MLRLKKRAEFLAAARGARAGRRAFSLQAVPADHDDARVGFTVTKKNGTATERNRIRRRLRAAIDKVPAAVALPGHAYVIVGRREALHMSFDGLVADLASAFGQLRARPARRPDPPAASPPSTPNPAGET